MLTISSDAKMGSRLPYEIDNMCERYRTSNGLYTFSSPSLEVLENYLFYLLRNSKVVDFQHKYLYNPAYLSFDEYGTTNLEYLLMYVNDVYLPEEFDLPNVVIPTMQAIVYICRDKYSVEKSPSSFETISW